MRRPGPGRRARSGGSSSASTRTGTATTTSDPRANAHTSPGAGSGSYPSAANPSSRRRNASNVRGDEELRRVPRRAPAPARSSSRSSRRSPQSTGRRLSGSTSSWFHSSSPWYTSGTPGVVHAQHEHARARPRSAAAHHLDQERHERPREARVRDHLPGRLEDVALPRRLVGIDPRGVALRLAERLHEVAVERAPRRAATRPRASASTKSCSSCVGRAARRCSRRTGRATSRRRRASRPAIRASAPMRARTSALRFVSCVVAASSVRGQSPCRTLARGVELVDGDARTGRGRRRPRSARAGATSRYIAVSSTPLAMTAPVVCWNRTTNSGGVALAAAERVGDVVGQRARSAHASSCSEHSRSRGSTYVRYTGSAASARLEVVRRRRGAAAARTSGWNVVRTCSALASAATRAKSGAVAGDGVERVAPGRIDEQRVGVDEELVAGGPLDRPRRQRLTRLRRSSRPRRARTPASREPLAGTRPGRRGRRRGRPARRRRRRRARAPAILPCVTANTSGSSTRTPASSSMSKKRRWPPVGVEVEELRPQRRGRARTGSRRTPPCGWARCRRRAGARAAAERARAPLRRRARRTRASGPRRRSRASSLARLHHRARGTGGSRRGRGGTARARARRRTSSVGPELQAVGRDQRRHRRRLSTTHASAPRRGTDLRAR